MKDDDTRIRELLSRNLADDAVEPVDNTDASEAGRRVLDQVRGRSRRLAVIPLAFQIGFGIAMSVTAVSFLKADNIHAEIMLGTVMVLLMVMALCLWTWMRTHRQATLREIKRLELALAVLSEKDEHHPPR